MAWLIGFLAIALVVAPVVWVMPTPGQRRQARMRDTARQNGLAVAIVDLPQSRRQQVRREDTEKGVSYSLPIAREKRMQRAHWLLWREPPEGEPELADGCPAALAAQWPALRSRMSADMVALESNATGYALYWRERGSEQSVCDIAALLEDVRQLAGGEALLMSAVKADQARGKPNAD